ncbi:hypothetical protein NUW58_g10852 [Xylaria curta]|uniref:Uncharacterized protein n=1 Tax=Xylaria curta TaxID=42375 RepID=A0ACC1MFW4_9PEZI|nr:hypothetical protein NUW58_g10852 [Xylaria curta]
MCVFGRRQDVVEAGIKSGQEVWYQFRFWNGFGGATPEREEASANHPLAGESWAQTVAKVIPPVTSWEQERWDVQLVPVEVVEESEGEIDWEYERELDEFCKQSAAEGQQRR